MRLSRKTRASALVATTALLLSGIVTAAPATAATSPIGRFASSTVPLDDFTPDPNEEYTAVINGVEYDEGGAAPFAAPVGCSASDPAGKRLNTYQRRRPSGVAKLECGNSSYGWRHIAAGKAATWQGVMAKYGLGTDWASFAKWNINNTVGAPTSAPYDSRNQTYKYQAPLQIRDNKGKVVRTYTVTVPVGRYTERVITVFPKR